MIDSSSPSADSIVNQYLTVLPFAFVVMSQWEGMNGYKKWIKMKKTEQSIS